MSYDSTIGRWLERDPLGYVDGLNLYEDEAGNPINSLDPQGTVRVFPGKRGGPPAGKCALRLRQSFPVPHVGLVVSNSDGSLGRVDGSGPSDNDEDQNRGPNGDVYNGITINPLDPGQNVPGYWNGGWFVLLDDVCSCLKDAENKRKFDEEQRDKGNKYQALGKNSANSLKCYLGKCGAAVKFFLNINPIGWGSSDLSDCDGPKCKK